MKQLKIVVLALIGVSGVVQAQVEKPAVMDEAMVSISIPEVHSFLDEVGLVASKVSPMMNGSMLKSMIGMQLGDMNLAGIPADGGLSIVALDPTNIFVAVEVSEAQSSAYLNMAKAKGLQVAYTNGLLLAARSMDVLDRAGKEAEKVKSDLLAKSGSELSVAMQPSVMIERNREAIDGFLAMMPTLFGQTMMSQPGATLDSMESLTRILEGELRVLISLSEQSETAELRIIPINGALLISETFVPKAGTPLADLVNRPAGKKENPNLHAGMLGEGALRIDFVSTNPDALTKFISIETKKLIEAMKLDEVNPDEFASLMTKWSEMYKGTGAEVVSLDEGRMGMRYAMEIVDEKQALETFRSMEKDMEPMLKMYADFDMPMKMTFEENVREAEGVKVHRWGMAFDVSGMPDDQKEQFEAMGMTNMVYEMAFKEGLLLYAEEGGIENLMQQVKAGGDVPKIAARSTYPAGGFYYLDLDMGEYMAFMAQAMPDDPSTSAMQQQMGTIFAGTPPITSAGFKEDGAASFSLTIPGEVIAKYGQMIMMAQMQNMQSAPVQ